MSGRKKNWGNGEDWLTHLRSYEACVKELADAKKLSAKQRLQVKERAEEEFRKVKEQVRHEREAMRGVIAKNVEAAEHAWGDAVRKMFRHMSWFKVSFGVDDFVNIDGDMVNNTLQLPCMLAEKVAVGVGHRTAGKKDDAQGAYYTIKLETTIYRSVHKIQSRSKFRDQFRTLLFTVSQENYKLRFIGYDFETSDLFTFTYSLEEQEATVRGVRELTTIEIGVQFQLAFMNVEYVDDGLMKGTKRRKFKVQFASEIEGAGVDVHMSDAEQARAAKQLDAMMNATGSRAKSRQAAAQKKLEDEKPEYGVLDDSD